MLVDATSMTFNTSKPTSVSAVLSQTLRLRRSDVEGDCDGVPVPDPVTLGDPVPELVSDGEFETDWDAEAEEDAVPDDEPVATPEGDCV